MFSVNPRRSSRKWICSVGAVIAAAAIAVPALASSAFAVTDTIQTLTPPRAPAVQLGGQGSCQAGLPPSAAAVLDWADKPDGTIQPKLTASLCLQNTTHTHRVALQLYYLDSAPGPGSTHVMISESK